MLEKVKDLNRDLPTAIPAIILQTSYEIELLNKQQLYNYGVDSTGKKLKKYINDTYAKEKNYMNRRPGFGQPDLFFTGKFYKGFTVNVNKTHFKVDSVDFKSEKLKDQYGDKIFGLTKSNIKVYALGVFYTELQKFITIKTGLIFR
jgi:hypothetical protein